MAGVSARALPRPALRVELPSRSDPRLRLSLVLLSVQLVGQVFLGFKVSIAQIVVTIALCGAIEAGVGFARRQVLAWPASGLLTGNGIALLLRAAGTRHGDWWSLNGIEYFALAGLIAMASRFLMRPGGRHLFNPSNAGLVACLLLVGAPRVYPQYLWWGDPGIGLLLVLLLLALGAVVVLRPLGMLVPGLAFMAVFGLLVAWLAADGNCFAAIWHQGPVCGREYWTTLALSPETLIFALFMISDPRTAPAKGGARLAYAVLTALAATALIGGQHTEFGVKLGLLAGLVVSCAAVPVLEGDPGRRLNRFTGGAVAALLVLLVLGMNAVSQDLSLLNLESGRSGRTVATQ